MDLEEGSITEGLCRREGVTSHVPYEYSIPGLENINPGIFKSLKFI